MKDRRSAPLGWPCQAKLIMIMTMSSRPDQAGPVAGSVSPRSDDGSGWM